MIEIPLDAIESVEVIGSLPCKEHSHPVATIAFRQPAATENAWVFSLLTGTMSAARMMSAQLMFPRDEIRTRGGEEALGATSTCTRCIRDCGRAHIGDPIGYMICALNCPC